MVGFRNIAVRDYQKRSLDILRSTLESRLPELEAYARLLIRMAG
jgi:uncharacterized protein YutE (UPF0331/DUF86 family)